MKTTAILLAALMSALTLTAQRLLPAAQDSLEGASRGASPFDRVLGVKEMAQGTAGIAVFPLLKAEISLPLPLETPVSGRMYVVFSKNYLAPEEIVESIQALSEDMPLFFAHNVDRWDGKQPVVVEGIPTGFPGCKLDTGLYYVSALLDWNPINCRLNADGNFISHTDSIRITANAQNVISLSLSKQLSEPLPPDTGRTRFEVVHSNILSAFWGREYSLKVGVLLPEGYDPVRERYFAVYDVGGYGARYTRLNGERYTNPDFLNWWSEAAPPCVLFFLDGDGPFGDPYWLNSACNGPFMDALIQELIPYLESKYRAGGTMDSRFLRGGSTGGFVSLALQVFNPDFFGGAWSFSADPVTFRHFQRIDLYGSSNAYTGREGDPIPSCRDSSGAIRFTVKDEVAHEMKISADGRSFVTSGQQWGGWNAVFSEPGPDGLPQPVWDPLSGEIDRKIVEKAWRKWDLTQYLLKHQRVWKKVQSKLHVHMGMQDDYFLNEAMLYLYERLSKKYGTEPLSQIFNFGNGTHQYMRRGLAYQEYTLEAMYKKCKAELRKLP